MADSLWELLIPLKEDFDSPISSGFISMLARTIPSSIPDENINIIEEDREKELIAALSEYHPISFNWDALFTGIPIPIAQDYPYSDVHSTIYYSLLNTKSKIQDRIYYPLFSNKTIGRESRSILGSMKNNVEDILLDESTQALEILYSRSEVKISGTTEMRTSFSLNDLRPRSYYARGPTVYYPSRYIQPIFNILVDMFPVTNRRARFILSQLEVSSSESLFIYDYSSFTSTLFEIRNFTEALSRYFTGTTITIIDSFHGPTLVDLGEMLHDFNLECNVFPEFTVPDFKSSDLPSSSNFHRCGMLGVPGNISSCTLLHGMHLAILLCSVLCRCVGDDAIGKKERELVTTLIQKFLPNIGHVSLEKSTIWDFMDEEHAGDFGSYGSWYYTKRPITRHGSRIVTGFQAIYPPITYIMRWKDDLRTFTWPATDELYATKAAEYIKKFGIQFISLTATERELEFANRFVHCWNRMFYHFTTHSVRNTFILPRPCKTLLMTVGQSGFEDMVWSMARDGWRHRLPKRSYGFSEEYVVRGYRYTSWKTQSLSFAFKLGFADMEEETEIISDPFEFFTRFTSFYTDLSFRSSYSWLLSVDTPDWLISLIRDSLVDPPVEDDQNLYDEDYESDTD